MTFDNIIEIIKDKNLCKNWEIVDHVLNLYYTDYDVYLLYDDGNLITILKTHIKSDEYRKRLAKYFEKLSHYQVFSYDANLYIQSQYKRFTIDVILDNSDLSEKIDDLIKLLQNVKKSIQYPHFFINEEITLKSNYPISDNELL